MCGLEIKRMLDTKTECHKCSDMVETISRCTICDNEYCNDCEGELVRCDICSKKVCLACRIADNYTATHVCGKCQDEMYAIKANYESLTKSLAEALVEIQKEKDPDNFGRALGYIQGRLEFMKAQYGF